MQTAPLVGTAYKLTLSSTQLQTSPSSATDLLPGEFRRVKRPRSKQTKKSSPESKKAKQGLEELSGTMDIDYKPPTHQSSVKVNKSAKMGVGIEGVIAYVSYQY